MPHNINIEDESQEENFIASNVWPYNNNFLFAFWEATVSCMESALKYLAPELRDAPPKTSEHEVTLYQDNAENSIEDHSFYSNDIKPTFKDKIEIKSAITFFALRKMGASIKIGDNITSNELKKIRRASLLANHPDKSSKSSGEFIAQQDAYALLLAEECNFNETEQERNARRYSIFADTIFPQLQSDQKDLKSKLEEISRDIENSNLKVQEQISALKNELRLNQ